MTRGCKAQERPAGWSAAEGEVAAARGACCGGGEATHASDCHGEVARAPCSKAEERARRRIWAREQCRGQI
jgi:hypothetical protein